MSNKIFKKKKRNERFEALMKSIRASDEFSYIFHSIAEEKPLKEILEHLGYSKQRLHVQKITLFDMILKAEPEIQKYIDEFSVYLDLKNVFEVEWIEIIKAIMIYKNKHITYERLGKNHIVLIDKAFAFKQNNNRELMVFIANCLPCPIDFLAAKTELEAKKLKELIAVVYRNKFIVMDNYILSSIKKSIFVAIANFAKVFDGNAKELFEKFYLKYPDLLSNVRIKNFDDFSHTINRHMGLFPLFIQVDGKYELVRHVRDGINHKISEKLVNMAVELSRDKKTVDMRYLIKEICKQEETNIAPMALKDLLLASGKFHKGKRLVVFPIDEFGKYYNITLVELIDEVKQAGITEISDIIDELYKRGRSVAKQDVQVAMKKIRIEKCQKNI